MLPPLGRDLMDIIQSSRRVGLWNSLWESLWANLGGSLRNCLWDDLWRSLWIDFSSYFEVSRRG